MDGTGKERKEWSIYCPRYTSDLEECQAEQDFRWSIYAYTICAVRIAQDSKQCSVVLAMRQMQARCCCTAISMALRAIGDKRRETLRRAAAVAILGRELKGSSRLEVDFATG